MAHAGRDVQCSNSRSVHTCEWLCKVGTAAGRGESYIMVFAAAAAAVDMDKLIQCGQAQRPADIGNVLDAAK